MVVRLLVITVNTGLWTAVVALMELILVVLCFLLSDVLAITPHDPGRKVPLWPPIHRR